MEENKVNVKKPNESVDWHEGQQQDIKWKHNCDSGGTVRIDLLNEDNSYCCQITEDQTDNGTYPWKVGTCKNGDLVPCGNYRIEITVKNDHGRPTPCSGKSGVFDIKKPS